MGGGRWISQTSRVCVTNDKQVVIYPTGQTSRQKTASVQVSLFCCTFFRSRLADWLLRNVHVASLESALKTQKTDEDLGLGADGERARAHTQELRCDAEIALTFMFK